MIFIDTGYLIALSQPSDALYERARAWTSRISEPLLLTQFVLVEVVNHLSRSQERPRANLIVSILLGNSQVELLHVNEAAFNAGWKLHQERPDKNWSLTDCISFHVMNDRQVTRALAYDVHFEQAGFEALLRRDP